VVARKKRNVSSTKRKELKKWKEALAALAAAETRTGGVSAARQIQRRTLRRGKDGPARTFRLISRLFNL